MRELHRLTRVGKAYTDGVGGELRIIPKHFCSEAPPAKRSKMKFTVSRVPLTTGLPTITSGVAVI